MRLEIGFWHYHSVLIPSASPDGWRIFVTYRENQYVFEIDAVVGKGHGFYLLAAIDQTNQITSFTSRKQRGRARIDYFAPRQIPKLCNSSDGGCFPEKITPNVKIRFDYLLNWEYIPKDE